MLKTKERASSAGTKIERLDLDLRIRATTEGDIMQVANMLTHALLEEDGVGVGAADGKHNKQQLLSPLQSMKFRNIRSGVAPLLQSRMNAIKIGRKILHEYFGKGTLENMEEADQLRLLWSNDNFRKSVEKAASLSNEPHIWNEHNFACAPQSFNWLFHKMITAENAYTGEIIGFCEIAMLSQPSDGDSSESNTYGRGSSFFDEECSLLEEEPGVPTIVNLVTSANYRRRGVGSTVMNSAMNYLQKSSSTFNEIALYVEEENDSAIKMYERLGFLKDQRVESKKHWYMTRQIPSVGLEKHYVPKVKTFR
jgi:ribosomal protein S18 acetylase RimI-like enzyme